MPTVMNNFDVFGGEGASLLTSRKLLPFRLTRLVSDEGLDEGRACMPYRAEYEHLLHLVSPSLCTYLSKENHNHVSQESRRATCLRVAVLDCHVPTQSFYPSQDGSMEILQGHFPRDAEALYDLGSSAGREGTV